MFVAPPTTMPIGVNVTEATEPDQASISLNAVLTRTRSSLHPRLS
jgi:hypothetical protein